MDGTYTERWMGSGGFSFLESTTAFLGGSEATYSLPGTKTNNNLVGCLKKVLISSIIEVLERIKYKKKNDFLDKRWTFGIVCGWKGLLGLIICFILLRKNKSHFMRKALLLPA